MIAGALATLLASGAYFATDSIKTNANVYRNANRMDDKGVFWPTHPEVERMLQHDIRSLLETGKRDFILEGWKDSLRKTTAQGRLTLTPWRRNVCWKTAASLWMHGVCSIGTPITVSYSTTCHMVRMRTSGCAYINRKSFWHGLRMRKKPSKESLTLCIER